MNETSLEQKTERLIEALRSVYQNMKAPIPNSLHQMYINEVLEEIGEEKEE